MHDPTKKGEEKWFGIGQEKKVRKGVRRLALDPMRSQTDLLGLCEPVAES